MAAWSFEMQRVSRPFICHRHGMCLSLLFVLLSLAPPPPPPLDARSVVTLIMIDRFADGADNRVDVVVGHPRRYQGGDLAGLRRRLPWLKAAGISHVWLTPLHDQVDQLVGDGSAATAAYHGYWPEQFTAVDPHFGSINDLKAFVAEAAALGIGVIVDVVANHTGYGAKDPQQLVRKTCGTDDITACIFGLPDLATEDPRVRAVVVDNTRWWLQQAPFVGVRLDAFKHLDTPTAMAITSALHATRPGTVVIAERWGAEPGDATVAADVNSGAADAAFDFGFMGLARDFVVGRLRPQAFAHHLEHRAAALSKGPPMFTFLDNHDVETWATAVGDRAPLGAALLLTTPGIPVITWGTDVGRVGGSVDPANRTMLDWAHVDDPLPARTRAWWAALTMLRRTSSALQSGTFATVTADDVTGAVVFQRQDRHERVVVVVAGKVAHTVHIPVADEAVIDQLAWPMTASALVVDKHLTLRVPAHGASVVRLSRATMQP